MNNFEKITQKTKFAHSPSTLSPCMDFSDTSLVQQFLTCYQPVWQSSHFIHVLAYKHWWSSNPGSSVPLPYNVWQDWATLAWCCFLILNHHYFHHTRTVRKRLNTWKHSTRIPTSHLLTVRALNKFEHVLGEGASTEVRYSPVKTQTAFWVEIFITCFFKGIMKGTELLIIRGWQLGNHGSLIFISKFDSTSSCKRVRGNWSLHSEGPLQTDWLHRHNWKLNVYLMQTEHWGTMAASAGNSLLPYWFKTLNSTVTGPEVLDSFLLIYRPVSAGFQAFIT